MLKLIYLSPALLLAGYAIGAEPYYQADPAKLAQMQAERCAKYQNESKLIRKRLTSPNNRQTEIDRMKTKLQSLDELITKNCPAGTNITGKKH